MASSLKVGDAGWLAMQGAAYVLGWILLPFALIVEAIRGRR